MIYAEKHLSLLSRMGRDGLQLRFTGEFPEEILDQTCKKIEDMGLQEQIRKEEATQIQRELIQVPEFAELYQALCAHGIAVSVIQTMLHAASSYQEHLSQYPKEQMLEAAVLDLKPSLKFEYMKHYQPLVRYEEEEQAVADNLDTFPVLEWQEISPLTEHQRSMMRLPYFSLQAQARCKKPSRPTSSLVKPSAFIASTTFASVAMEAWSVPGSHNVQKPCMRL